MIPTNNIRNIVFKDILLSVNLNVNKVPSVIKYATLWYFWYTR